MDPNRCGGVPLSPRNAARPSGGGARLALFAGPLFIALGVGGYKLASLAQDAGVQPSAPTLGGMAASWRSFSAGFLPQSRAGLDRRRNGLRVGHVNQTGADAKARQAVADARGTRVEGHILRLDRPAGSGRHPDRDERERPLPQQTSGVHSDQWRPCPRHGASLAVPGRYCVPFAGIGNRFAGQSREWAAHRLPSCSAR
jgi:hypothetical protein